MSALITTSRLRVARSCLRRHLHRYGQGYQPVREDEPLRFGTLVHRGLEAWWNAYDLHQAPLEAALQALRAEADPFDRARAEALLIGYQARWGDEDRFYVIDVEQRFETELRNPVTGHPSRVWRLAGKLDVLVRDSRDGLVKLMEHKTSSEDISQGSAYWRRLRMDGQVSIYYEGARSLGHDVAGCIYDVIGKPALRPLKATPEASRRFTKDGRLYAGQREADETSDEFKARLIEHIAERPDAYYQRGEVVRLQREMDDAILDVWQFAQHVREADLAGRHPRNPDACVQFGRTCPFFDVCSGAASLDDPRLFTKSERIHPELEEAHGAAQH